MFTKVKKQTILLLGIVFLALCLRVYNLDQNPAGFFCDEASVGYNAYSILTTRKDEHQKSFPLFFEAFGEYKNPVLIYSLVPIVKIFGLNEFSIRLGPAIYGILTVLVIYLLATKLWNEKVGLVSAFLLAISPWHILISRVALEGLSPLLFFLTIALYFFMCELNDKKKLWLSFLFFGIATYSYFPARLCVPLFIGILSIVLIVRKIPFICILKNGLVFVIIVLPLFFHMFLSTGLSRWKDVSPFKPNIPITTTLSQMSKTYFIHFSPEFLFVKGDADFPGQQIKRHSILGSGELYLFQFPFLIAGFFFLLKSKSKTVKGILLIWIFLYPIGSTLTTATTPQATRSLIGVIPFQILTAIGIWEIFEVIKSKTKRKFYLFIYWLITGTIISVSFFNFLGNFQKYPLYSSDFWGWQYGPKDIISYFQENEGKYDELFMSGQFNAPYIFLKFYSPENCQKCKIGNLENVNPRKKQLFALTPNEITLNKTNMIIKKNIFYPNGQTAFLIFEP